MKRLFIMSLLLTLASPARAIDDLPDYNRRNLDAAAIAVPMLDGWEADSKVDLNDGVVLRLTKPMPVAGAPRIDFYVQPQENGQPPLKQYINQNLQSLAKQEKEKQIKITYRDQRNVRFNGINAVRYRYDYQYLPKGPTVAQISYFFSREDRLVMVNAFGLSELYMPLSNDIEAIIQGCLPIVPGLKGRLEPLTQGAQSFFTPQDISTPDMVTGASKLPNKLPEASSLEQLSSY